MNKRELVREIAKKLSLEGAKKRVHVPKRVFTISEGGGASHQFSIKERDKDVMYTKEDVALIVDRFLEVICDTIRHGGDISIRNFGTFGLQYAKPRTIKSIHTGEDMFIDGHYIFKFWPAKELSDCAKVYNMILTEHIDDSSFVLPDFDFEDDNYVMDEEDIEAEKEAAYQDPNHRLAVIFKERGDVDGD